MAGSVNQLDTKDLILFLLETEHGMLRKEKDDMQKKFDALKEFSSQKLKEMRVKSHEIKGHWKTMLQENLVLIEFLTKWQKTLVSIYQLEEKKSKWQEALEISEKELQTKIKSDAIKDEFISWQWELISRAQDVNSYLSELISCQREEINLEQKLNNFRQKLNDFEQKLSGLKDLILHGTHARLEALYLREAMIKFEKDQMFYKHGSDKIKRGEAWQTFFSESNRNAILKQYQFQDSVKDTVTKIFFKLNTAVFKAYRTGKKVFIDKIPFSNNELTLLKAVGKLGLADGTLGIGWFNEKLLLSNIS